MSGILRNLARRAVDAPLDMSGAMGAPFVSPSVDLGREVARRRAEQMARLYGQRAIPLGAVAGGGVGLSELQRGQAQGPALSELEAFLAENGG